MAATPANIPDVVTNPYASAQTALQFGPQTQMALRRSQYLADALRQMQESGSQNIRSGGELAAKLLANAILMRGNDRAQNALVQAMQADRQGQISAAAAGTPLEGQFQSPPPPMAAPEPQGGLLSRLGRAIMGGPAPSPAPALPAPMPSAPAGSFVSQDTRPPPMPATPESFVPRTDGVPQAIPGAAQLSDADKLDLARTVWGEARGEPAAGQQAVAAVILNRARESGQPIHAVVAAPHQFSGYNPQSQAVGPDHLQPILANISPALQGQDPTNGADHFYNPALANPAWGNGAGQMIGQHKFMALGYGGGHPQAGAPDVQMTSGPAPQGQLQIAPTMADAQGQPQPYQVASNGPTPPPPQGQPGPQDMPHIASPPQAMAQAQAVAATIPHQLVTPEEWNHAAALVRNWRTYDAGMAYLEGLKRRSVQAIELPKDMMWDAASGRAVPIPGTQYTQIPGASPTDVAQRDPFGKIEHQSISGLEGAIPPGYMRGPNNTLVPMGAGGTAGPAAPSGPVQGVAPGQGAPKAAAGPANRAPIPPALQKPFMDTLDAYHKAPGYTDYVSSLNAANALEANLHAALGNNTVVDQTAVDATIRAMTGLSARQGSVNAVLEHLPWSEQLKGFVQHAIGPDGANGYITPKVLSEMRTAVHAYADGHRSLAEQEYANYNGAANRMGFDLGQDLPTVTPPAPVKWMDGEAPAASAGRQAYQGLYWKGGIDTSRPLGDAKHPFLAETPQILQSLDRPENKGKHVITPDGQLAVIE